ncbi:MAG: hypothetical protein A2283_07990 [Lentisphaerae bacterium RIFOXYA12_FULL_48_11]|nr:MAG: hypothetical protein A2283_07990 [Lentisphaerae bacterium RIFOXYA12_FULL_48_11]
MPGKPIVPSLSVSSFGIGVPGTITRSFPVGRSNFFRINEGQKLHLEVDFVKSHKKASVALFTNLNNNPNGWHEVPFRYVSSHKFMLDINCSKPGRYCFKVKYTMDGQKWAWDCVPFSYVMVDPLLLSNIKTYTLVTSSAGSIGDWTKILPHVRELDCNVLHLLPVTRMGATEAPYAAKDLFSIDPAYLDPASKDEGMTQFSRFADEAAKLDIHLCIDLVFNHVSDDSNIARLCPEWIQPDEKEADGFRRAGWQAGEKWYKWEDLVLLDYEHPNARVRKDLWNYMCHYGIFWAEFAARTKGMIRLDNLHSSNHAFMNYVLGEIRETYPDIIFFAELFTDTAKSSELVWDFGLDLMLATPWEHHFVPQLRGYLAEVHRRDKQTSHVLPITSHDSGTPAQEFGSVESTVPRYVISALMGCGATGLVQGVEYGLPQKIHLVGIKPAPEYTTGLNFTPFIAKINRIMDENSVFQRGDNIKFLDNGHDAIIAAYRFDEEKRCSEFIVLCNFDTFKPQSISIDLNDHIPGANIKFLEDLLTEKNITPSNGSIEITMQPCSAMVLRLIMG